MTTPNPQVDPPELGAFLPGGPNPETPPSAATAGYRLNHLMLRIRSPARSLHFYKDLLGMRTVFVMNAGPFTLYYLGYPPPSAINSDSGSGGSAENPNQDPAKALQDWVTSTSNPHVLTQTLGLLELYHVHGTEKPVEEGGIELSTGSDVPNLGFGHVGLSVPDVPAAVERLRERGVRVFKELGDVSKEKVPISDWEVNRGVGTQEIHENYQRFWGQIAFVLDPVCCLPSFLFG